VCELLLPEVLRDLVLQASQQRPELRSTLASHMSTYLLGPVGAGITGALPAVISCTYAVGDRHACKVELHCPVGAGITGASPAVFTAEFNHCVFLCGV
jgi:hypothetical protein